MDVDVARELAALRRMTPAELREKYAEVFGEASRSGHKQWLIKRIIWRIQANALGDLSERAKRRALELANDADLRLKAPRNARATIPVPSAARATRPPRTAGHDPRLPMPGTLLTRPYKGQTVAVQVRADGFEYDGRLYSTLSSVARAVTGTHTNGYLFFRLGQYGSAS